MTRYLEPINNETITDLLITTNMYAEGWLGAIILLIVFSVLFFGLGLYTKDKGFVAASLITAILSILLRILGILSDIWMYGAIILAIIGIAGSFRSSE